MNNLLIKGDNIKALKYLRDDLGLQGKISLVYIDPPFATGGIFSVDPNGRIATVSRKKQGTIAYTDTLQGETFIQFLKERIEIIYDLLADHGSFYLHIDYKIGHYVKVMLDSIFGIKNFRNDITRIKCNPKNFSRIGYGNIKDLILFYTKGEHPIWNEPRLSMSQEEIIKLYPKIDKQGRRYTTVPIHAPGETKNGNSSQPFKGILPPEGRHWRCSIEELEALDRNGLLEWSSNHVPRKINYADEHLTKRMQDIWEFKDPQHPKYPTEKNSIMLQTIIKASSNEGSIILDCFAGSGSTLIAATELNRHWIGVDISDVAIKTIKKNLEHFQTTSNRTSGYQFIEL